MFKFAQVYGAKEILEGGPWIIAGRYLVLRWWTQGMPMVKDALTTIPVWVQLYGIPLEYWSAKGMSYIGSVVGAPLYADAPTEQGTRLKFARLCIEIDASKPLTEELYIKPSSTEGNLIKIKAVY